MRLVLRALETIVLGLATNWIQKHYFDANATVGAMSPPSGVSASWPITWRLICAATAGLAFWAPILYWSWIADEHLDGWIYRNNRTFHKAADRAAVGVAKHLGYSHYCGGFPWYCCIAMLLVWPAYLVSRPFLEWANSRPIAVAALAGWVVFASATAVVSVKRDRPWAGYAVTTLTAFGGASCALLLL